MVFGWALALSRAHRSMAELRTDFIADPEMMIMAEVLLLNTALHTIELKKNRLGDDGVLALARAVSTSKLPIRVLHLDGNLVSAEGATELARGVREGNCPLEQLDLSYNLLDDAAVTDLAEGLSAAGAFFSLQHLWLGSNKFGDGAVRQQGGKCRLSRGATEPRGSLLPGPLSWL